MDMAVLFSSLMGLFLLIGVGFFAVRAGLLPAEASKPLSTLLMKITLPATVLTSLLQPFDPSFLVLGGWMFALGAVLVPLFALLSLILSRAFRVPEGRRGMWCCTTTFFNNGFMGFPIALALFGEEGLTLTVIMSVPFTLLAYSVGAKMVCMDLPKGGASEPISWKKVIFSAVNLAMAIGLLLYFTQIQLPDAIETPLVYLSNVTTPLSMLITGMNLSQGRVTDILKDRDVFASAGVRLLLFPLLAWGVMRSLPGIHPLVMGAALINMSMPSLAAAAMLGEQYGGCTQLAARAIFLSSLLCLGTIPLIALLL